MSKRVRTSSFPTQSSVMTTTKSTSRRKKVSLPKTIPRAPVGYPKHTIMRHKYVGLGTLTCTAGVLAKQAFIMNGLYDPDLTGAGHQPLYFDNQAAIYDHYVVTKSFVRVSFAPGNTMTVPGLCGLMPSDDGTTSLAQTSTMAEQTGSQVKFILESGDVAEPVVFKYSFDAVKTFGPDPQDNNSLQGTSAANPSETSACILWLQPSDGTTAISVYWMAEFWFEAIWSELKDVAES